MHKDQQNKTSGTTGKYKTATVPTGYVTPDVNQEAAREFGADLGTTIPGSPGYANKSQTVKQAFVTKDDDEG